MEERKAPAHKGLVLCALYAASYFIFYTLLKRLNILPRKVLLPYQVILLFLLAGIGLFLFQEDFKNGIRHWKEKTLRCFFWVIGGYIAEMLLLTISSMPLYLLYPDYTSVNDNTVAAVAKVLSPVLAVLLIGVVGPLTEELVMRVAMTHKAAEKIPAALAILISSLCFMMIHVKAFTPQDLLANIPMFCVGLVYGFIIYKTKDPTLPILIHILNNLPAVLGLLL